MKKNDNSKLPIVDIGPEIIVDMPKPEPDKFLLNISKKLKIYGVSLLIFLVVFLIGMIFIFRNDITVENYQYLIRYLTSADSEYTGNYEPIYFDSTGSTRVDIFHSDLAVLKGSGITLYNMLGNETLNYSLSYSNPILISDGKYMLTYDLGGYTFDLFNNFSKLESQTYEYPISNAAISSEGMYAVVTKSLEYQSVVYLYDHNFNLLSKISKDKFVMGISINDSASEILVLSAYAENGVYKTEISTYHPYEQEPSSSEILSGCLGIKCDYHSDGSYTVLTSDSIRFYDSNHNLTGEYEFTDITPSKCEMGDSATIITYNKNVVGSTTNSIIFDNRGEILCSCTVDSNIIDIALVNSNAYLLGDGIIYELTPENALTRTATVEGGATSVFAADLTTLICGYTSMAQPILIEDNFENIR